MIEGKRILVTGVSGVLGSALAGELALSNVVYGLARFSDRASLEGINAPGIIPVKKDLATDSLDDLPDRFDYIFNLGAVTSDFDRDQNYTYQANAYSIGRLMRRWSTVKAFVHASTSAVYRYQPRALTETDPLGAELETYSTSKFAGEIISTFASELWGIPAVCLRIFQAFGPRGGRVTSRIKLIAEGQDIALNPDTPNIATPHYIIDFVSMAIKAAECSSVPPRIINVAGSNPVRTEEYLRFIGEILGVTPRIVYENKTPKSGYADVTLMRTLLGEPRISLEEGIRRVIHALYPDRTIYDGHLAEHHLDLDTSVTTGE